MKNGAKSVYPIPGKSFPDPKISWLKLLPDHGEATYKIIAQSLQAVLEEIDFRQTSFSILDGKNPIS